MSAARSSPTARATEGRRSIPTERAEARRGPLWAITSYFNPCGYRSRRHNYRVFRQKLGVPLVSVELSNQKDGFELETGDAEILVQRFAPDVMWQKERLLNLALEALPRECESVAWIDCDVVFQHRDWMRAASEALKVHPLVQLFDKRWNLGPGDDPENPRAARLGEATRSVGSALVGAVGDVSGLALQDAGAPLRGGPTCGLAWAARRSLLERHGLYDACVVGSGDRAMVCAALGRYDDALRALRMTERQNAHYRAWAEPFFADVGGQVGCVPGDLLHLWHGDLEDRCYADRHELLRRFDFDPFGDIARDARDCWRWNSDKAELHRSIRSYFDSRREDGPESTGEDPADTPSRAPILPSRGVKSE